jgi:prophage antirepressor-like protein
MQFWLKGSDVARILGYSNAQNAIDELKVHLGWSETDRATLTCYDSGSLFDLDT